MFYLIYKITNTVNNKIYVGKHKTEDKNDSYMGSGLNLRRAIKKYGIDKFTKEILYECNSEEEMNQRERDIVDKEFVCRQDTYNIMIGGDGGWEHCNKGLNNKSGQCYISSERMKKDSQYKEDVIHKISNSLKERWKIDGHNWTGRKHSEETKRKIGLKNKERQCGEKHSHYGTFWIFNEDIKESKRIKKDEKIPCGWEKGRKFWK